MLYSSILLIPTLACVALGFPLLETRANGICYHGADFPDESQWLSFNTMFNLFKPLMAETDSGPEIGDVYNAIVSASQQYGIDERIILGVIIRESTGNVRMTPGDGGRSKGMMQTAGAPDCVNTAWGQCSQSQISAMINSGVGGTSATMGLQQCYDAENQNYAAALRCYNSGPDEVDWSDLANIQFGTKSYVSDVGNFVTGANSPGNCGF